jgi:hypothetical protein
MRFKFLLPLLLLCVVLAGCETEDLKETGISRSTAITIAKRHCAEYPDTYSYVDKAEWDEDGKFWVVDITDYNGDHGKAYKIARNGYVIETHKINHGDESDEYGPHHYGYGYGYGPGYWW